MSNAIMSDALSFKPWSDEFHEEICEMGHAQVEEVEKEAWAKCIANEFLADVFLDATDNMTVVSICPVEFFNDTGYCFDGNMLISHLLPDDFEEVMETTYCSERSVEEVREDLKVRGFQFSDEFTEFLESVREEE